MASYQAAKKNTAFQISITLQDFSTPGSLKLNPTIATGDFKTNGDQSTSAPSDLGTTPVLLNAASAEVEIILSATEMNFDVVYVQWVDQTSPKEWCDGSLTILTSP